MNNRQRLAFPLMFLSIPLLWILVTLIFQPSEFLFPSFPKVFGVLVEEWGRLMYHTGATLKIALLGYVLANLVAIAIAVTYLYMKSFEEFSTPWTILIKNLPLPVYASILIVMMGDTLAPKVLVVIFFNFFPILANMSKGLREVDQVLIDRCYSLNASQWTVFRKVRMPAALPYFIAAQEIALTGAITGAIVSEWFFAQEGLGYLIVQASTEYRSDRLFAVGLLASVIAIFAYLGIRFLESYLFRWRRKMV
ncbi:ABC transporter permease [Pelagicoccus albus]|uniref:ABC transporter permease n=1 Tax=Pelagicoccus albus TaxID=415222 RepID=A0A7X1BBD7_9BACT|nr:ABC transporter permease [Pelagicoccus albus]MBC2607918.1 ABC transporter permease [Pelagicoccus albus]